MRSATYCLPTTIDFPPLPSLPPPAACALNTTEGFPCSLPPPGLVLICSSTATVGLTYREARTVECGNCGPRTRRGEEVGLDDYHMLPSLPISRTSITIITFYYFLFSFLSTRPLPPTFLFSFGLGGGELNWFLGILIPTGIFHAAERSMPWFLASMSGRGGEEGEGLWCGWVV